MRHINLETWTDTNGTLGLIIAGMPKTDEIYADHTGRLIAHDLLEHQNGVSQIGCPRDELQALGGVWNVRGRWGHDIGGRLYTPAQALATDVLQVAIDAYSWEPHQLTTRPHDYDDDFREILDHARPMIIAELPDFPVTAYLEEALHHLRTGFRKAERRYRRHRFEGLNLFTAVQRAIEPHAKHIQFEGQRFRLSYGDGEARCEEVYPYD